MDLMLRHPLPRDKEIGHRSREIEKPLRPQRPHQNRNLLQLPQILRHARDGQHQQQIPLLRGVVLPAHRAHLRLVLGLGDDVAGGAFGQIVKETVRGVAVVPGVGEKRKLTVEEDYSVPGFEEILGGGGAAGAGGEVVYEAHGLVLKGDGGAAGGDEDYTAFGYVVVLDEGLSKGGMALEVFGGWVGFEVVCWSRRGPVHASDPVVSPIEGNIRSALQ